MEAKIIKQEKNPFLQREEIVIELTSNMPPTIEDVKLKIGKNPELTVIKKINTNFGRKTFLAEAVVYDNAEAKKKIEVIPKKIKKKMEEERKAEEETRKKAEEAAKVIAEEKQEEKTE